MRKVLRSLRARTVPGGDSLANTESDEADGNKPNRMFHVKHPIEPNEKW